MVHIVQNMGMTVCVMTVDFGEGLIMCSARNLGVTMKMQWRKQGCAITLINQALKQRPQPTKTSIATKKKYHVTQAYVGLAQS
jgi:hypothetical protein